jgi:hypothetical protein
MGLACCRPAASGDDRASIRNFVCFKLYQPCDRDIVRMRRNHKALFHAQVAGIAAYARQVVFNDLAQIFHKFSELVL